MTTTKRGQLAGFLKEQRRGFLAALDGGDAKEWVVVMGNEAGGTHFEFAQSSPVNLPPMSSEDLDSLASSIAYSSLSSTFNPTQRSLPLLLTPRTYMSLRPENILALETSLISTGPRGTDDHETFLHLEDLPVDSHELARRGVKFALVDHNTLLPPFRAEGVEDPVVAIIDHHADDGSHIHASPRIIQIPTGSTTSLVTMFFKDKWRQAIERDQAHVPAAELATLLLSGILIDTGALKAGEGAKTTETDRQAAEYLWGIAGKSFEGTSQGMSVDSLRAGQVDPALTSYANTLFSAKNDVTSLSTHDLLLRDYKEYTMSTRSPAEQLTVGLSTVPLALSTWLSRDNAATGIEPGWKPFLLAVDAWMAERNLDVAGMLTTFNDPLKDDPESDKVKGKHRRELAFFVRARQPVTPPTIARAKAIADALTEGINAGGPILDVKLWKPSKPYSKSETLVQGLEDELMVPQLAAQNARFGAVWRQGNASSTRKQVAPLVVSTLGR